MFRARKNVLNSLKFQKKHFVRYFSAVPSLPEFADVVIIGESAAMVKQTEGNSNFLKTVVGKAVARKTSESCGMCTRNEWNWDIFHPSADSPSSFCFCQVNGTLERSASKRLRFHSCFKSSHHIYFQKYFSCSVYIASDDALHPVIKIWPKPLAYHRTLKKMNAINLEIENSWIADLFFTLLRPICVQTKRFLSFSMLIVTQTQLMTDRFA